MSLQNLMGKVTGQPASHVKKANYQFGRTLGAGTFGVVKYARMVKTGAEVAIKVIVKKTLKGNDKMVYDELALLQGLHHPHIVEFRDWFESKDKFYIVTQLATGGELFDRICDYGRFTEADACRCIRDIVEALAYLHDRNIVHRDLKPENLLYVTADWNSELVLADFGIAKALTTSDQVLTSMAGSFGYAAPEILRGTGHGKPCDIWSLGVITYTVLSGYSPFRAESVPDFLAEVGDDFQIICHERYWKHVSQDARRFIQSMLQVDQTKRPTAAQLLQDPWLSGKAAEYDQTDLLPGIKTGFDARKKFRKAIEAVKLANRIRVLGLGDDEKDVISAGADDTEGTSQSSTSITLSASDETVSESSSSFGTESSAASNALLNALARGRESAGNRSRSRSPGAKFQEVVMAAARNKDLLDDKSL